MINPSELQKHDSLQGVYFLFSKKGEIVYIGSSRRNILNRVFGHRFKWHSFAFIGVRKSKILSEERKLIRIFKPKYNRNHHEFDGTEIKVINITAEKYMYFKRIAEVKGISLQKALNDSLENMIQEAMDGKKTKKSPARSRG